MIKLKQTTTTTKEDSKQLQHKHFNKQNNVNHSISNTNRRIRSSLFNIMTTLFILQTFVSIICIAESASLTTVTSVVPKSNIAYSNVNNKTLKLTKQKSNNDDEYYEYEQYEEKSDAGDGVGGGGDVNADLNEYSDLNEHLLTKSDVALNSLNESNSLSKPVSSADLNNKKPAIETTSLPSPIKKSSTPAISSSIKHLSHTKHNNSKHSTKLKINDDEYYDYGQEDYYQLAAGDLKTVKDGTLTFVTESNPLLVTPSLNATVVYELDERKVIAKEEEKADDLVRELITPTVKPAATITTTIAMSTVDTVTSKRRISTKIFSANNVEEKILSKENKVISTATTTPSTNAKAAKNENYDEEYNDYYDEDEEASSKKTTDAMVTNKKLKMTSVKVKTTMQPSTTTITTKTSSPILPNVKLNKQSKTPSNSTDQDNYDEDYENYDEDYYDDYEEEGQDVYGEKNEKKAGVSNAKVLSKEQTKTGANATTTEDEYDEYYDDAYYEEDNEDGEGEEEVVDENEENYKTPKSNVNMKTNKTQGEANYELEETKLNANINVTTTVPTTTSTKTSSILISTIKSFVPLEKPKKPTTNDENEFYETDTEWDTNETDYYDFNFKTKPNNYDTTTPPLTDQNDLSKTKSNETSFTIHNFNVRDLLKSPALLAGIFGGLLLGIIAAFLLLIFIIYRVKRRKFEENSYMINGTLKSNARVHYPNPNRIYSRNNQNQHVTLLSSSSLSPVANLSGAGSSTSTNSATAGLLNGTTTTSARLLKYTNPAQTLRKTASNLSSDSSPNHDGAFNYAYIKAPTKEFYA